MEERVPEIVVALFNAGTTMDMNVMQRTLLSPVGLSTRVSGPSFVT
jgi:hypothetical protein